MNTFYVGHKVWELFYNTIKSPHTTTSDYLCSLRASWSWINIDADIYKSMALCDVMKALSVERVRDIVGSFDGHCRIT